MSTWDPLTIFEACIHQAGYTLIEKYTKTITKCKKRKVYSEVFCVTFFTFCVTFFTFCVPFFTFCISCESRHSSKNSKDFVVYFFAVLIKHEIRVICEKCIVSVSYFMVCFAKIFVKYPRNTKNVYGISK